MSRSDYDVNAKIAEDWYRQEMDVHHTRREEIEAIDGHCTNCKAYNENCPRCTTIRGLRPRKKEITSKINVPPRCSKCGSTRTHTTARSNGTFLKCRGCGAEF